MTNTKITLHPGMNHIELEKLIITAECNQDANPIWYKETKKKNGEEKYWEYDEKGNEVYYKWSNSDRVYEENHNTYDDNNNIISKIDKNDHQTTYKYDEQGREIHQITVNKNGEYVTQLFTEYDEDGTPKKYMSAPDSKVRQIINAGNNAMEETGRFIDEVYDEIDKDDKKKSKIPWWGKLIIALIIIFNPMTALVVLGVIIQALPYIVIIAMVVAVIKVIIKRTKNKNDSTTK